MNRYTHPQTLPRLTHPALPRLARPIPLEALRAVARLALIPIMGAISVALWIGSPMAWLWVAAQVTDSSKPGLGPYALLFGGILLTSVTLARLLGAADRAYQRLAGTPARRLHRSWLRARGQERRERPETGPLGVVMAVSVIAALIALVTYVLLSGRPLEPIPLPGVT
jgi:hypothetical protein